jgi:uncharacterized protein
MNLLSLLDAKRDEIRDLAARYGVTRVRLFGSAARGEAGPDSDLDFLIELEPGRGLLDHAGFMLDLKDLLGVDVDVVTEGGLKPRYREQVLQEAVAL